MKIREFRTSTIVLLGDMLDEHKELTEHLFHWPHARIGSITLEMNRNEKTRSQPFTEFDVMPHLDKRDHAAKAEADMIVQQKQIMMQLQSAGIGTFEIDTDPD